MPNWMELQTGYHVAPRQQRESIMQHGLRAQAPLVPGGLKGVYLWTSPDAAQEWAENNSAIRGDSSDIYEVQLPAPHVWPDPNYDYTHAVVYPGDIPPANVVDWHEGNKLTASLLKELLLPEVHMSFEKMASMQHEGQWADVAAKAKRLVQSGNVTIMRNAPHHVMAHVVGDHGEYNCEISRHDPSSQIIEQWNCECPWAQFAFDRTRKWKKLEGRVCSHVLATYWKAKSTPMDTEEVEPGQQLPPGQKGVEPSPKIPGMEPGSGGAPVGVEAPGASMPGEAMPEGAPEQVGPTAEPMKTNEQITTPKQPESPFQTPKTEPPQHEQLELFDVTKPPGMQPTPQGLPVSIPGGRPPTPGNPIAFPGTFSNFVPIMVVHSSQFIYATDAMSDFFEQQKLARKPIYVQLLSNVTLEQSGGKTPMPGAVPYGTSSEGIPLYDVMHLGYNPETGMRENSDVNALQGAPAQTGQYTDVNAGRRGEVLDYDDSLKMAYVIVPLNYPEGGDVRLHPHALVGWVDYKDLKPLPAAGSPWRK